MTIVVDASAVLAVIMTEAGSDSVVGHLGDAHLGTINMSEVIAKLTEYGVPAAQARRQIDRLDLHVHDFDADQAEKAAALRLPTKALGLSLGDRACLALAQRLGVTVLTADRRMADANEIAALDIRMIR